MIDYFPTLKELAAMQRYGFDDSDCLALIWRKLYASRKFACPRCGGEGGRFYRMNSRPSYSCGECGYHIHPLAGTIFENTRTPLSIWFKIIELVSISNGRIPALEIKRKFKVTYKCAWRMKHLICNYLGYQSTYSYAFSSATKPIPPHRKKRK